MPWQNADGLTVRFPRDIANNPTINGQATSVNSYGVYKELAIDIDLTRIASGAVNYTSDLNNDGTLDGFNFSDGYLPANAVIQEAYVLTVEAAVGGTSYVVGTYLENGTAISANSIVTATEGVIANINAIGKKVLAAGALATSGSSAGVGASNAFVGVVPTGTFTAGKVRVIIVYFTPAGS